MNTSVCHNSITIQHYYGLVTYNTVNLSHTDGINIWEQELGGDGRNVKSSGGLPPSVGQTDCGEDGL